jgi:hypothetical protein
LEGGSSHEVKRGCRSLARQASTTSLYFMTTVTTPRLLQLVRQESFDY